MARKQPRPRAAERKQAARAAAESYFRAFIRAEQDGTPHPLPFGDWPRHLSETQAAAIFDRVRAEESRPEGLRL